MCAVAAKRRPFTDLLSQLQVKDLNAAALKDFSTRLAAATLLQVLASPPPPGQQHGSGNSNGILLVLCLLEVNDLNEALKDYSTRLAAAARLQVPPPQATAWKWQQ